MNLEVLNHITRCYYIKQTLLFIADLRVPIYITAIETKDHMINNRPYPGHRAGRDLTGMFLQQEKIR